MKLFTANKVAVAFVVVWNKENRQKNQKNSFMGKRDVYKRRKQPQQT